MGTVSKESLVGDLRKLGIEPGALVLFHSSLRSIGRVEPGPEAVVEALLEVLGPGGTLVAPTLIPALQGVRPLFSVETSPSEMGLLTEIVRKWPGARRSNHPTHSVAAVGPLAEELTAGHRASHGPNTPWGRDAVGFDSPWDRLRERDAWVLMIGVDFDKCTLLHHVQVRYLAGREGVTVETPWPRFDFRRMGVLLEEEGVVRRGRLGNARCLYAGAGGIVRRALELLEERPGELFTGPAGAKVLEWRGVSSRIGREGRPRAAVFKADVMPPSVEREVGRPLHIRGLLLDHPQDGKAALVVWDHGAFLPQDGDPVREAISEATGAPFRNVLLTATHTHSDYYWPFGPGSSEHTRFVADRAGEAARNAVADLQPVRAGWASVHAPGINRNRTVYLRDGMAYTERWAQPFSWHIPPERILRRGPADEELRLLVLERLDGSLLAVVADFSCHNSAALKDARVNDDFFGVAMCLVESVEGKGCVALSTPGSQGDQDPTAMVKLGGTRDLAYAEKLGKKLAGYILAGIAGVRTHDLFRLGTGSVRTEVTVRDDWKPAGRKSGSPQLMQWAEDGRAPAEVAALAVGGFALVGIPAEFFTAPATRIRNGSPFECTAVTALTNGDVLYVAEKEAFFEGSSIYGVHANLGAMAEAGADRLLCEAAVEALRQASEAQESSASRECP